MSSPDVLLIGSVPFDSADEVFSTVSKSLKGHIHRIPDGETGERGMFVLWQGQSFAPGIKRKESGGSPPEDTESVVVKDSDVYVPGYDTKAIESYRKFEKLQNAGAIPQDVRFQVSLPSPYNVLCCHVDHRLAPQAEPIYERLFLEGLRNIQEQIPVEKLTIQIDLPFEFASLEVQKGAPISSFIEFFQTAVVPWFSDYQAGFVERVANVANALDPKVEFGIHLCYGDLGHVHYLEPKDAGLMVDFMNALQDKIGGKRKIDYWHIPVPKNRDDQAYFEPLNRIKIPNSKLYLGVVCENDEDGTRKRLAAARTVWKGPYGIASECGLGRTPRADIDSIFTISRTIVEEQPEQ